ncbi:NAD(P)-dependent alcohol dehydrogenase [Amycolatopsis endophytica]|uniref:alcohol dehydrogenase n=1 Tax=Amycolatopsis endophytica TaxID=860233 RepID=A0A853BC73_9PSEU|nr:zinc-binding dehydrogenase [Amycolatopsis endophytica]NYI92271.1 propanol-preferring alcohol dehydrogenase [Amycolatopsis endophytica]
MSTPSPAMMEAWQWTGTGRPLSRCVVPVPRPGRGEVLVAVRAAGMCHSDVGELDEPSWAENIHKNPITLGHEIAGEVAETGALVTAFAPGDRVAVFPMGATVPGYGRDGGYAAYVVAPALDLLRLPSGLSYALAALATDAGMTSHHAVVKVAGVGPGSRVGIIGLGGLGQIGARLAVLHGAEVHAADVRPEAVELGRGLDVADVVHSAAALEGRDLDTVIDFAGFGATTDSAVRAIRTGGTVVMLGLGAERTSLVTADVIHRKARIVGSSGGTREDIRAVLEHLASGAVTPAVEHLGFEQVPEGIERLREGRVTGRLVVMMPEVPEN